jgi:hypothetical protein
MKEDPKEGRAYETEDGLDYYVLSVVHDHGTMRLKYLVMCVDEVEPRHRKHLLDVGEIGDFVGPSNLAWSDRRIM